MHGRLFPIHGVKSRRSQVKWIAINRMAFLREITSAALADITYFHFLRDIRIQHVQQ